MNFQTTFGRKQAVAYVTTKCFLSGMNFRMWIQSTFYSETFVTVIALVRSFSCVRTCMSYEITWFAKCFRAIFTLIRIFLPFLFLDQDILYDMYIIIFAEQSFVISSFFFFFFFFSYCSNNLLPLDPLLLSLLPYLTELFPKLQNLHLLWYLKTNLQLVASRMKALNFLPCYLFLMHSISESHEF